MWPGCLVRSSFFGLFGDDLPVLGVRLCDPVSYDPAGRWTDCGTALFSGSYLLHCAGNFGSRFSVASGQTGKRRYSGRHFNQGSNLHPMVMAVWGLIVVVLLIAGAIVF